MGLFDIICCSKLRSVVFSLLLFYMSVFCFFIVGWYGGSGECSTGKKSDTR